MDAVISIIVTVHENDKHLQQCLQSLVRQTFPDIEIICVHDKCNDAHHKIIDDIALADGRIKIVAHTGCGLGASLNAGINQAAGQYVLFVSGNDYLEPEACQKLYHLAAANDCDMAFCACAYLGHGAGDIFADSQNCRLPFPPGLEGWVFSYMDLPPEVFVSARAPFHAWGKIYRKSFLDEFQLRFPENIGLGDMPFYFEALAAARRVVFTNDCLYVHRVMEIMANKDRLVFANYTIIVIFRLIYDKLVAANIPQPYLSAFITWICKEILVRSSRNDVVQRQFIAESVNIFPEISCDILEFLTKYGVNKEIINRSSQDLHTVSVIIPCYNCESFIEDTLKSILAQSVRDIEIICVDDCSTDGTVGILERFAQRHASIKILKNRRNLGPGASRDMALQKANSIFIFFLDGDDLLPGPNTFATMIDAAKTYGMRTVGGNISCFKNDANHTQVVYTGQNFSKCGICEYREYNIKPAWGFSRFLYDQEIIIKNNISFGGFDYYEDPYFFVNYMSVAMFFAVIPIDVYLYRLHKKDNILSYQQLESFFTAEAEILNILKFINNNQYNEEYNIFLEFIEKVKNTTSGREQSRLMSLASGIFNNSGNIIDVCPKPANKYSLKKIVKKYLQPVYAAYRDRMYNLMVNASKNSAFGTDARLNTLEDKIDNVQYHLDEIRQNLSILSDGELSLLDKHATFASKRETCCRIANGAESDKISSQFSNSAFPGCKIASLSRKNLDLTAGALSPAFYILSGGATDNLGDMAVSLAQREFLRLFFPTWRICEYALEDSAAFSDQLKDIIHGHDVIIFQGGGNLACRGEEEERLRDYIVRNFSTNKIIIFPQTVLYGHAEEQQKRLARTAQLFNEHGNILLFCRGHASLDCARRNFGSIKSSLMPDIALFIKYSVRQPRAGVGICGRTTANGGIFSSSQYGELAAHMAHLGEGEDLSTIIGKRVGLNPSLRKYLVWSILSAFAAKKCVITDRMHGLIFCLLTNTPCILINTDDGKIADFYNTFCHNNPLIIYAGQNIDLPKTFSGRLPFSTKNEGEDYRDWFVKMHDVMARFISMD